MRIILTGCQQFSLLKFLVHKKYLEKEIHEKEPNLKEIMLVNMFGSQWGTYIFIFE